MQVNLTSFTRRPYYLRGKDENLPIFSIFWQIDGKFLMEKLIFSLIFSRFFPQFCCRLFLSTFSGSFFLSKIFTFFFSKCSRKKWGKKCFFFLSVFSHKFCRKKLQIRFAGKSCTLSWSDGKTCRHFVLKRRINSQEFTAWRKKKPFPYELPITLVLVFVNCF